MKCETVKIQFDNNQGFYVCNKDSVPKGSKIFEELTEAEIKKYTKKAIKDIKRIKAKEVN